MSQHMERSTLNLHQHPSASSFMYDLYAVCNHYGTLQSGHYTGELVYSFYMSHLGFLCCFPLTATMESVSVKWHLLYRSDAAADEDIVIILIPGIIFVILLYYKTLQEFTQFIRCMYT